MWWVHFEAPTDVSVPHLTFMFANVVAFTDKNTNKNVMARLLFEALFWWFGVLVSFYGRVAVGTGWSSSNKNC